MIIEEGMYVRTEKNGICKISKIEKDLIEYDNNYRDFIDYKSMLFDIKKSSYNIIDLIEVGDYVNGYKIDYINLNCETPFLRSNQPYRVDNTLYSTLIEKGKNYNQPLHFYNEDIKTVVTKEQFENISYEVK